MFWFVESDLGTLAVADIVSQNLWYYNHVAIITLLLKMRLLQENFCAHEFLIEWIGVTSAQLSHFSLLGKKVITFWCTPGPWFVLISLVCIFKTLPNADQYGFPPFW